MWSLWNDRAIVQEGIHHKGNGVWLIEGKKGPRPNMFDTSLRIPWLVRWPGVVKPQCT